MEIYRGDIFYINRIRDNEGSEMEKVRPAVIVSNNVGNEHSDVCEVVFLTSKNKKPLPTHVKIICRVPSVALCEQITTVSKNRLGAYVRSCTEKELIELNKALRISLELGRTPDLAYNDLKIKLKNAEKALNDKDALLRTMQQKLDEATKHIEKITTSKHAPIYRYDVAKR